MGFDAYPCGGCGPKVIFGFCLLNLTYDDGSSSVPMFPLCSLFINFGPLACSWLFPWPPFCNCLPFCLRLWYEEPKSKLLWKLLAGPGNASLSLWEFNFKISSNRSKSFLFLSSRDLEKRTDRFSRWPDLLWSFGPSQEAASPTRCARYQPYSVCHGTAFTSVLQLAVSAAVGALFTCPDWVILDWLLEGLSIPLEAINFLAGPASTEYRLDPNAPFKSPPLWLKRPPWLSYLLRSCSSSCSKFISLYSVLVKLERSGSSHTSYCWSPTWLWKDSMDTAFER